MKGFKPGQEAWNKANGEDCIVNGYIDATQQYYDVYYVGRYKWDQVPVEDLVPRRKERLKLI